MWHRDLRYALRLLARNPGFTTVAVLTLALGIGANTAIFTVANATLLHALPFGEADRLVTVADKTAHDESAPVAYADLVDWQQRNGVFETLGGQRYWQCTLAGEEGAERLTGASVTAGFFRIFGLRPVLGRDFVSQDDRPGAEPVVILSYGLWQRRFQGSPAVLGRPVTFSSRSYTVVGVMPPFAVDRELQVFRPLAPVASGESRRQHDSLYGYGRLKRGITLEQARTEMNAIAERLELQYPDSNTGHRVRIESLQYAMTSDFRPILLILLGVVGFVLLIACANISNLLLARAAGRTREMAIRAAMGAGRGRIVRQLLTESVLLSLLGAGFGVLLSAWCCDLLMRWAPEARELPAGLDTDTRVLVFAVAVAVLTGIAAGLVPALQASRPDLNEALKEGGRSSTMRGSRFRSALMAGQVALAFTLLIGAGLFLQSLHRLTALDPGFNARNMLTLKLAESGARPSPAERQQFRRRVLEEVRSLPGVVNAVVCWPVPLGRGEYSGNTFYLEGRPAPPRGQLPHASFRYVSPGYFRTMGIRLERGREFEEGDRKAAIVNQTLARRYWPDEDPIGRRFYTGSPEENGGPLTVVGVAADTREYDLEKAPRPQIYCPMYGAEDLVVRTAGDPLALASAIRKRIVALDRNQVVYDIKTVEQRWQEWVRPQRSVTVMLGVFAAMALLLAAIGIYGVIAHLVQRRTQEIGVRMALGAQPADVSRWMVAHALLPVVAGVGLGGAGAYGVGKLLAGLLAEIRPAEPVTFLSVAALVTTVALAACYLPTRRAMRVDPVVALRHE